MKRLITAVFAAFAGAVSAATWNPSDSTDSLTNELVVAAGETYTLTADDASRLGSTCLHVTGEGTVVGTADFAAFTGSIRLSNGIYQHKEYGGLGSTNATHTGDLVIDGGTLESFVAVQSYTQSSAVPSVPIGMTLYLSGTGYQGKGAIVISTGSGAFVRKLVLAGDALVTSASGCQLLGIRYATFKKGASESVPKLTARNVQVDIVCPSGGDTGVAWDVTVENGSMFRLENYMLPFRDSAVRLSDTSSLQLRTLGGVKNTASATAPFESDYYADLFLSDSSSISVFTGTPTLDAKGTCLYGDYNRFAGAVSLAGMHAVKFGSTGVPGIAFDGVVSGAGGLVAEPSSATTKPGWVRLSNAENTFAGGVTVRGAVDEEGAFLGGLSLLASGAAPVDGGAIALSNATLRLNNSVNGEQAYELPSIAVADGGEILDNLAVKTGVAAKGLTKTGDGTLTLSSPVAFSGLADVQGGTLKLVADTGALRGLSMWWCPTNAGAVSAKNSFAKIITNVKTDDYYQGLDGDVSWAYQAWGNYGNGAANNSGLYQQSYYYEGDLCIPGEADADVTFNFVSCLTRNCQVTIDDTVVVGVKDTKSDLADGVMVVDGQRLCVSPAFTMKAGWHKVKILMNNFYNGSVGPLKVTTKVDGNTVEVWPANFGIGVDWQGRCTTNTADYAKLQDSGDGSLLRWSHDASLTLPRFNGGIAFAAGTTLDLGGAMAALTVPSFAGTPTIRGGALKVTSTEWSLRTGDVVVGKPLTVESGSSLLFGEENAVVTVTTTEAALRALRGKGGKVKILAWASETERPANSFVASDAVKEALWDVVTEDDGVYLLRTSGTMIIIR